MFFFYFCCSLNLYELIKKNNYQGFSLSLIRRFAISLISCLRLLYRENIIHCDLKPVSTPILPTVFTTPYLNYRKLHPGAKSNYLNIRILDR